MIANNAIVCVVDDDVCALGEKDCVGGKKKTANVVILNIIIGSRSFTKKNNLPSRKL